VRHLSSLQRPYLGDNQSPLESSSSFVAPVPTTTAATAAATKAIDIITAVRPVATTMRPSPVVAVDFGKSNPDLTDSESDGESPESLLSSSLIRRRQQPIVTMNKNRASAVEERYSRRGEELLLNPHRPIPLPHLRQPSPTTPNVPIAAATATTIAAATATTTATTPLSHAMPSVALTTAAPLYHHKTSPPITSVSVSISPLSPAIVETLAIAPVAILRRPPLLLQQQQQQQQQQRSAATATPARGLVNSPSSIPAMAATPPHSSLSANTDVGGNAVASDKLRRRRLPVLQRPISIEVRRHPTNAKWLAVKILGILSAKERALHLEAVTDERLREALGVHGAQLTGITDRQTDENNDAWHVAFEMNADYLKKLGGRTAIINSIGYYAEIQP
jgi:hypothetical protein